VQGKTGDFDARDRLARELVACRDEARRISQDDLAELARVSRNTISDIERAISLPKAGTLRKLANGLATYAPGRRDNDLADEYYERLMRAAGYAGSAAPPAGSEDPSRRARPSRTEHLAPMPGGRLSREERQQLLERYRAATAELEAVFRALEEADGDNADR